MYFEDVEAIDRTYGETLFDDATNAKISNKIENFPVQNYFGRKHFRNDFLVKNYVEN